MNKLYADFLKIKEFFTERQREYVLYNVKPLSYGDAYSDYCTIERFRDGFSLEFPWDAEDYPELCAIDPYDSFSFGIYCMYYGDRIELSDCNRTWECGVEAYEGTGLASTHYDEMAEYISKHGFALGGHEKLGTVIKKVTGIDSFVRDAIELIRVMLTVNRIDEEPPYLHEDNPYVLQDVAALEQSWLTEAVKHPMASISPRIVDLTQSMENGMPVFPGDPAPSFKEVGGKDRFDPRLTNIIMNSHTGTHIDAPSHYFEGGRTISDFPVDYFVGKALVIDCRGLKKGENITKELILSYGKKLEGVDILLFHTGWDKKWGSEEYFMDYPTLDTWACAYICKNKIRGIGFDTPSIDLPTADLHACHLRILSDNNIFVAENLKDLGLLGDEPVRFVALPLNITDADGAPARVIAIRD